ncbi:hypothetical protein [Vibrio jasicida]|uniref:hypothetical protein n=1 Tax=Vibrio jasicida TaxID=766224 RepID=UPI0005EE98D6|nr:hypothetical protein [Vibrio jasicida]
MPIYNIKVEDLPEQFPTHNHSPLFWESLGRTIATYGFLEETLLKAIFALSVTKETPENEELELAYEKWVELIDRSLSDQLGNLIDSFGKQARIHQIATSDIVLLVHDLHEASKLRNVLCHGSWGNPNSDGYSLPFFFNRNKEKHNTPIDVDYLNQVHQHVIGLICSVMNTVTQKGFQFPGTNGPGKVVWKIA